MLNAENGKSIAMLVNFPLEIIHKQNISEGTIFFDDYFGAHAGNIILVSGKNHSLNFANVLTQNIERSVIHNIQIERASIEKLKAEQEIISELKPTFIIGIGGGSVIDFAKQLSLQNDNILILAPTIISNDGLVSPISVLFHKDKTVSLSSKMPEIVLLIDEIIKKSPEQYLQAAACDILSNLSASNDWKLASKNNSEQMQHLAYQFSQIAANSVLSCRTFDVNDNSFYRCILDGQVLSGMAMAFAGSSRPCSGSEHLISHAIDSLSLAPKVLHGRKIGVISKFILSIQGVSDKNLSRFFSRMSVQNEFPGCEAFSYQDLTKLFALARTMRPGRYTILDAFSDSELADIYLRYVNTQEEER